MSGTKTGAMKAKQTNIRNHGEDFYREIGKLGGSTPTTKPKGFAADKDRARTAGAKGGRISKRTGKIDKPTRRKWGIF